MPRPLKKNMIEIFIKGGPIMWPLLLTSIISISVVIERLIFIALENKGRNAEAIKAILKHVEQGDIAAAESVAHKSQDFVVRILAFGLQHRHESFSNGLLRASNQELKRFNRGLSVLDTVI